LQYKYIMQSFKAFIIEAGFGVNASRSTGLPMTRTSVQTPTYPVQVAAPQQTQQPKVAPAVTTRNVPTANIPAKGMNGKLNQNDPGQLVQVEPNHYLAPDVASSFKVMKAAAAMQGINLSINNAYRSLEQQIDMARRFGLYSQGGKAAQPGTSNHGLGRALDLNVKSNPGAFEWLKTNAAKYGFTNIPREPWHWEIKATA
jgi:LAS superfamily LD-carboxypeptidase LdcB